MRWRSRKILAQHLRILAQYLMYCLSILPAEGSGLATSPSCQTFPDLLIIDNAIWRFASAHPILMRCFDGLPGLSYTPIYGHSIHRSDLQGRPVVRGLHAGARCLLLRRHTGEG